MIEVSLKVIPKIYKDGEHVATNIPEPGLYPLPENYNHEKDARYAPQPAYCHVERWEYQVMLDTSKE